MAVNATNLLVFFDATFSFSSPNNNLLTTLSSNTILAATPGPTTLTLNATDIQASPQVYQLSTSIVLSSGTDIINLASVTSSTNNVASTLSSAAISITSAISSVTTSQVLPSGTDGAGNSTATGGGSASPSSTAIVSLTPQPSKGYSKGATAGIAVASAIGAALVVGLIAWFVGRYRRQTHKDAVRPGMQGSSARADRASSSDADDGTAMKNLSTHHFLGTGAHLASPIEDRAIVDSFSKLDTLIRNHVHSFYSSDTSRTPPVSSALSNGELHRLLGSASPASPKTIAALLVDPKVRAGAIRFLLAWTILSNVEVGSPGEITLLPPELAECLQTAKTSIADPADRLLLLSKWRQITGTLMRSAYGGPTIDSDDRRQPNIGKMAERLNAVLTTYATTQTDSERRRNLEEIIKLGARLGYTLLTQPTSWVFDWEQPRAKHRPEVVIFPSLIQTGDDQGHARPHPVHYGKKQTMNVDSVVT